MLSFLGASIVDWAPVRMFSWARKKIIVVGDSGHGLTILIDESFRIRETLRTGNLSDFRVHLPAYKLGRITEMQIDSKA